MEYFLLFFGNFLHGDTDEKIDLGNKERPTDQTVMFCSLWGPNLEPLVSVVVVANFDDLAEQLGTPLTIYL